MIQKSLIHSKEGGLQQEHQHSAAAKDIVKQGRSQRTWHLLEVVGESDLKADSRAGDKASGQYAEGEFEVVRNCVAAADLSFELAAAQIEVAGYAAEDLGAESQTWREVANQRSISGEDLPARGLNPDQAGRAVACK